MVWEAFGSFLYIFLILISILEILDFISIVMGQMFRIYTVDMMAFGRQFDSASWFALRWMAVRVLSLVFAWSLPWLLGRAPFEAFLMILFPAFSFAGGLAMWVACVRRERIGAPSFNTWDEALVFSGLASLVHAVHRLVYFG